MILQFYRAFFVYDYYKKNCLPDDQGLKKINFKDVSPKLIRPLEECSQENYISRLLHYRWYKSNLVKIGLVGFELLKGRRMTDADWLQ